MTIPVRNRNLSLSLPPSLCIRKWDWTLGWLGPGLCVYLCFFIAFFFFNLLFLSLDPISFFLFSISKPSQMATSTLQHDHRAVPEKRHRG